jgi:hypothetical protein
MILETYRIYFNDGTSTLIEVVEDGELGEAILDLCDDNMWMADDIIEVHFEGATEVPDPA